MTNDQTHPPVDAGLVETMITAFFDALDEQIDNTEPDRYYELWASLDGYRAAMRHAIVATGGAVLDPETVQAVRRVLDEANYFYHPEGAFGDHRDDLARIAAALPKEREG
jgi:fermentation-respiration switch protein FrsA (DUF1100 family)